MYYKKLYLNKLTRTRAGRSRNISKGLFLDRNERCVPFNSKILKSIQKKILKVKLNLYPELEPFYIKLAKWLKVNRSEIFITEGVSGAVKSLIECFTLPGKNNIIFALYPVYCKMFDVKAKVIKYDKSYKLKFNDLIKSIDKKTAIVFLPNPNVPIAGTINLDQIKYLAKVCKKNKTILALDEVYFPFGNITGINLIKNFSNLIIMRSFSKAFGLAGIRFGYIVGNKENVDYISKSRSGYETNSISIEIASFFIDNKKITQNHIKEVKKGLDYLKKELIKEKIEFNLGKDNCFIFINLRNAVLAKKIVKKLTEKNIYVRGGWSKPFDQGFSVTGASPKIMKNFFDKFNKILRLTK